MYFINKNILFALFLLSIPYFGYTTNLKKNDYFLIKKIKKNTNQGSRTFPNKILKDSKGFLWYTTELGLVKQLNDYSLIFPFSKNKSKTPVFFYDIIEIDNKILTSTDVGIFIINYETEESYWIELKNPNDNTTLIGDFFSSGDKNNLFITSHSQYNLSNFLIKINLTKNTKEFYEIPKNLRPLNSKHSKIRWDVVFINHTLKNGNLILSSNVAVFKFDSTKEVFKLLKKYPYNENRGTPIRKFSLIKNGKLFKKGTSGKYTFKKRSFIFDYLPEIDMHIVELPSRNMIALEKPSSIINQGNSTILSFGEANNLLSFYKIDKNKLELKILKQSVQFESVIYDYFIDSSNILYISTKYNMYKLKLKNFSFKTFLKEKNKISTRDFVINSKGEIFIGTYNGLFRFNQKKETLVKLPVKEKEFIPFRDIYLEKNDSILWIVNDTYQLFRLNIKNYTYKSYTPKSYPSNKLHFLKIYPLKDTKILLGSSVGLLEFDTEKNEFREKKLLNKEHNLSKTTVNHILKTKEKWIIGTLKNGLYIKDIKLNKTTHYTQKNNNLLSNTISVIHIGNDGSIYIGTSKGINILNTNTGKVSVLNLFNTSINNSFITGILENDTDFWISTYDGLIRYDKINKHSRLYTTEDGITDNEFNQNSYFKANDSTFFFGGIDGFIKFNPPRVSLNKTSSIVYPLELKCYDYTSDSITIRTKNLKSILKKIKLPYNQNNFSLKLGIPNQFNSNGISYKYKLEPLMNEWVLLKNSSQINLYSINPGNYTLKIFGIDNFGNKTKNQLEIPIVIEQLFYKTPIFIGLALVVVLGLLTVYFEMLKSKWKDKVEYLYKIDMLESKALRAQMNPHFIFNTLNGLQSSLIFNSEKETNKYISSLSKLLRSSIDLGRSDYITLQDELKYLKAYTDLEQLRTNDELDVKFKIDLGELNINTIKIPCLMVQPIIENSIMHGLIPKPQGPKSLTIEFIKKEKTLIIIVTDNGIGRIASEILNKKYKKNHRSMSTQIMMDRIDIFNHYTTSKVEFKITDLYDQHKNALGTKVTLKLPLNEYN